MQPRRLLGQAGRRGDPDRRLGLRLQGADRASRSGRPCGRRPGWLRGVWKRPGSGPRTGSARGFSLWSSSCESRSVSSPSSLGSLPSLASFWIRLASSKADRQLADDEPELPDVLHRVAFAAGELAEQEPDHDHDRDDHRRDHEQLHHEPGRGGLDRRQVGQGAGGRRDRDCDSVRFRAWGLALAVSSS